MAKSINQQQGIMLADKPLVLLHHRATATTGCMVIPTKCRQCAPE